MRRKEHSEATIKLQDHQQSCNAVFYKQLQKQKQTERADFAEDGVDYPVPQQFCYVMHPEWPLWRTPGWHISMKRKTPTICLF